MGVGGHRLGSASGGDQAVQAVSHGEHRIVPEGSIGGELCFAIPVSKRGVGAAAGRQGAVMGLGCGG